MSSAVIQAGVTGSTAIRGHAHPIAQRIEPWNFGVRRGQSDQGQSGTSVKMTDERISTGRVPALDGLRGVAIIAVFVAHLADGVFPHHLPLITGHPVAIGGGVTGVQLFFVLSGFLITTILLREYSRYGQICLTAFYVRRFFRILPPLLALSCVFGVIAILSGVSGAFGTILRALTFTQNISAMSAIAPDSGWLSHTWSLAVEEQFYLVWPFVLTLLISSHKRALVPLLLAGILLVNLARLATDTTPSEQLFRWDAPLLGALLAVSPPRIPFWILSIGVGSFGAMTLWFPPQNLADLYFVASAVASGLMLQYAFESKWLCSELLRYFGTISYQLYLWHLLVMRLPIPTLVTIPISIGIAHLCYRIIDIPCIAMGHSLSKKIIASRQRDKA